MLPDNEGAALLRMTADDPEYRRLAAAEAAYWQEAHPFGFETTEKIFTPGPVQLHMNERFTGDPHTDWISTIPRWGTFRRGLVLGTSSPEREIRLLEANPGLHITLVDISAGAVERRARELGARFPGRVASEAADLNFIELPAERYDLIVSSSTIHHVTNLEYLAFEVNRALTPAGHFFLEDYVGEPRFGFSEPKRRLYEMIYNRDIGRERGRKPGLHWLDASDLSPFCGVRSDEILEVFRRYLDEVQLRTAATLTIPMSRSRPADLDELLRNVPRWKVYYALITQRLGIRRRGIPINPRFLEELVLVGDLASEAGLLRPGLAFVVYRKRPS